MTTQTVGQESSSNTTLSTQGSTTRRDTGIAGDAVILLANILKRLEQEIWTSGGGWLKS